MIDNNLIWSNWATINSLNWSHWGTMNTLVHGPDSFMWLEVAGKVFLIPNNQLFKGAIPNNDPLFKGAISKMISCLKGLFLK